MKLQDDVERQLCERLSESQRHVIHKDESTDAENQAVFSLNVINISK